MGVRHRLNLARFHLTGVETQGSINVAMIEHINDVVYITIGPKREANYKKVQSGVAILLDPDTGAPFGLMIVPGLMNPRTVKLPLWATLIHCEEE